MAPQEGTKQPEVLRPQQIHEIVAGAMEHVRLFNGAPVYVGRRAKLDKPFSDDVDHKGEGPAIFTPTKDRVFLDAQPTPGGAFTDVVCASVGRLLDLSRKLAHPGLADSKDVRDKRNNIVQQLVEMRQVEAASDPEDQDVIDDGSARLDQVITEMAAYMRLADGASPEDPDAVESTVMAALELTGALLSTDPSASSPEGTEG